MPNPDEPPPPKPGDIPCTCGWPMHWTPKGYALRCPRCDYPPTGTTQGPPTGGPSL